jgi:hypothetical protein
MHYSIYVAAYTKQNWLQAKKVAVTIKDAITREQFNSTPILTSHQEVK